ncbi:MAG: LytTR family DNA-binding domain-containing protein [Oscillospiraceae bacterium]
MKLAICDDEKIFRDKLQEDLLNYSECKGIEIECDHFDSGEALLAQEEQFDIVFMDFQMNGLDGLETARRLRKNGSKAAVIFTTNFPGIVFDTFEVNAFRFLPKPVDQEKLFKALDAYIKSTENDFVLLKTVKRVHKVYINDIIYAEGVDYASLIRTMDGVIHYAQPLSALERLLPNHSFYRCHKSYIAGLRHIKHYDDKFILFYNGEKASISRMKLSAFKDAFMDYILSQSID